jgi:hypothetical protein
MGHSSGCTARTDVRRQNNSQWDRASSTYMKEGAVLTSLRGVSISLIVCFSNFLDFLVSYFFFDPCASFQIHSFIINIIHNS